MSAIARLVLVSSLDLSLSSLSPVLVPSESHVEHARLFGIVSPIVVRPGSLLVLSGHYQAIVARAAGVTSVPVVDAVGSLPTDRPVETSLALDRIRAAGTEGMRASLMARAMTEGATYQGVAERSCYSVKHVQNLIRVSGKLAPVVRAAWEAGTLGTKVAFRLAALPHDAQISDDDYRATTPEHAAAVKLERAADALRKRLAKIEAESGELTGKPVAPVAPAAPVAPVAPDARALRSVLESTLAALPTAAGKDAARMRGIVDALAFALGDVTSIPSLTYAIEAAPVEAAPVEAAPVEAAPVKVGRGKARRAARKAA